MQKTAPGLPLPQAEVPRPPTPPGCALNRLTVHHIPYPSPTSSISAPTPPATSTSAPTSTATSPPRVVHPVFPPRPLPSRPEITRRLISMHAKLQTASGPNAFTLHLPVPSGLNIPEWRHRLRNTIQISTSTTSWNSDGPSDTLRHPLPFRLPLTMDLPKPSPALSNRSSTRNAPSAPLAALSNRTL